MRIILLLVVLAAALAGCGSDNVAPALYEGKSAKEWKIAYDRVTAELDALRGPGSLHERQEKVKAGLKNYNESADKAIAEVKSSTDGTTIVAIAERAIMKARYLASWETVQVPASSLLHELYKAALPSFPTDAVLLQEVDTYNIREQKQKEVRLAAIGWFAEDPKRLRKVYDSVRLPLRSQYQLLKNARMAEKVLKTPYAENAFRSFVECIDEYEYVVVGGPITGEDGKEIKRTPLSPACVKEFARFGVQRPFGDEGLAQFGPYKNPTWVAKFLARRAAEGGESFAREFQKLGLDYIKP